MDKFFKKSSADSVGIDIGTSSVKLVHLRHLPTGVQIIAFAIKPLPEFGKQEEIQPKIIEILKTQASELKLSGLPVYFSIPSSDCIIKRIQLPQMPYNELQEAVKWEMKSQIDFDINLATIGFGVIGEFTESNGTKKIDVVAAVAKEQDIYKRIEIFKQIGLKIAGITITSSALAQTILACIDIGPQEIVVLVDIGKNFTDIAFVKNGILQFTRQINIGSKDITSALLTLMSLDEAEDIKIRCGIPYEDISSITAGKFTSSQILAQIRPVIERLAGEIRRSFDYYKLQFKDQRINRVVISGGGSRLKNLNRFLEDRLMMKVDILMPSDKIKLDEEKAIDFRQNLPSLAVALGSAIGVAGSMNMVPLSFKMEELEAIEKISLRIVGTFIGVGLLISYGLISLQSNVYKKQLATQNVYYRTLQDVVSIKQKASKHAGLINSIVRTNPRMDWLLKELSNLTVEPIVLDELSFRKDDMQLSIKGVVFVRGGLTSEAILAEFLMALEGSPYFEKVSLVSSSKSDRYTSNAAEFEILCNLLVAK